MMLCDADFEDLFPDLFGPARRGPDQPPAPRAGQGIPAPAFSRSEPAPGVTPRLVAENRVFGRRFVG